MGAKEEHCLTAIGLIGADERVSDQRISSLYRTSPVGPVDQEEFVNCALVCTWQASPRELLFFLQSVEKVMGRERTLPQGPRIIDLDILLFGTLVLDETDLTIPHPELHRRRFAILPVLDLDPAIVHPRFGKPLASFLPLIDASQRAVFLHQTLRKEAQ